MKYLDCPSLSLITSSLDRTVFGDCRVCGQIEAYSCKLAGGDKHLLKKIASAFAKENVSVSFVPSVVPTHSAGLRLMTNIVSAMNASFPEHDFSKVRSESFELVKKEAAIRFANVNLSSLYPSNPSVITDIWGAIDEVIEIKDCKVLVFNPRNPDLHPYGDALWKFIFLLYNPKLNRLLIFGCSGWSNASPRGPPGFADDDEAEEAGALTAEEDE